jgi:type IV secretory pathway VirB2 component (pilin)
LKQLDGGDVMVVLGLAMLGAGLGAYDWRLALVVCGGILLALGLVSALRTGRKG